MDKISVRVTKGGRVVLPAGVRQALGIHDGDALNLRVVDGEMRLQSQDQAIRKIQALVRRHVPETDFLSEELIAERRLDAQNEARHVTKK